MNFLNDGLDGIGKTNAIKYKNIVKSFACNT